MSGGEATGCSDCGHIGKNHKTPTIRVQVTSVYEIPITSDDKKHILWDNKDLTKFTREIIGHGIFSAAKQSHVMAQMDCEIRANSDERLGNIKMADVNRLKAEHEKKYVDMIHYSTHEYTVLKYPDSKGDWRYQRQSGYAGYRCQNCAEWVKESQPQVCSCDTAPKAEESDDGKIKKNSFVTFSRGRSKGFGIVESANDEYAHIVYHNGIKISTIHRLKDSCKLITRNKFHKLIEDSGQTSWYSSIESIKAFHGVTF
jgi:hypothetical protein